MMKSGSTTFRLCFLLPLVAMTTGGCVKRMEVIAVLPDGRVELLTMFSGDAEDITASPGESGKNGSPSPSAQSGWNVSTKTDKAETDAAERKITVVATMSLKPGAALPATYAKPNSPLTASAIRFPTSIRIEKTPEGTYYHFKRTYARRLWAPFEYHRQRLLETDEIKKIMEKKPQALTQENRELLARTLIAVEREQQVELLHQSFGNTGDRIPQRVQLASLRRVREIFNDKKYSDQAMLLLLNTNGAQDTTAIEDSLAARIIDTLEQTLANGGVDKTMTKSAITEYQNARRDRLISQDLEDESWGVELLLPGKIVAHDGQDEPEPLDPSDLEIGSDEDSSDPMDDAARMISAKLKAFVDNPGFETYSWSFDAKALHDRDVVLMATSFVPNKK
ncbi:MAG: hypothetical protein GXP29_09830 [Planctomycetes bacterium]|nr:hypothetical protein [Planctomycetota bacterium]